MRLFIGIEPPDSLRMSLACAMEKLSETAPGKYVRPDMLHITLAFPGETDEERLEIIKMATEEAAGKIAPFEITTSASGYFGRFENAILFWGTQPSMELENAANIVRESLFSREIPFDPKPFVSHITLARHARLSDDALAVTIAPETFTAGRITLYHSHRVDDVLTYTPIFRAALRAERAE